MGLPAPSPIPGVAPPSGKTDYSCLCISLLSSQLSLYLFRHLHSLWTSVDLAPRNQEIDHVVTPSPASTPATPATPAGLTRAFECSRFGIFIYFHLTPPPQS